MPSHAAAAPIAAPRRPSSSTLVACSCSVDSSAGPPPFIGTSSRPVPPAPATLLIPNTHSHSHSHSAAKALAKAEVFSVFDSFTGGFDRWCLSQRVLGEGSFAKVRLARGITSGQTVVVKSTSIVNRSKPKAALFSLCEALALAHLPPHPNIPRLIDFVSSNKETQLLLDLAPGVELFSYVNSRPTGRLGEPETRKIVRGVLEALHHVHANNILHRDIKLDNIFWDPVSEQVSLLDFGLATFFDATTMCTAPVGCINYASPQLLRLTNTATPYPAANGWSDLWALAVLTHGLLTGYFPFRSEDAAELEREIATTWMHASELEGVAREEVSDACRQWLHLALDPRTEGRISAADLLDHPWLRRATRSAPGGSGGGDPPVPVPVPAVVRAKLPPPPPPPVLPEDADVRVVARAAAQQLHARLPEIRERMRGLFLPPPPLPTEASASALPSGSFSPPTAMSFETIEAKMAETVASPLKRTWSPGNMSEVTAAASDDDDKEEEGGDDDDDDDVVVERTVTLKAPVPVYGGGKSRYPAAAGPPRRMASFASMASFKTSGSAPATATTATAPAPADQRNSTVKRWLAKVTSKLM